MKTTRRVCFPTLTRAIKIKIKKTTEIKTARRERLKDEFGFTITYASKSIPKKRYSK